MIKKSLATSLLARLRDASQAQSHKRRNLCSRSLAGRIERLEPRIVLSSNPLITEFMASNSSTLADGDGAYSDWIEVHNPSSTSVSLDGWFLTDDSSDLDKWAFPSISLAPNEYLVVFASAPDDGQGGALSNYVDAGGFYHTNFKLSADGEYLGLTVSHGSGGQTVIDDFGAAYPAQRTDVSYGVNQNINSIDFISADSTDSTALVPTTGALDAPSPGAAPAWTLVGFDDSSWQSSGGGTGVGFDAGDDNPLPPSSAGGVVAPGLFGHDLTDPEDDGSLTGTLTDGSTTSPSGEGLSKSLDNSLSTKYLGIDDELYWQFRFNGGPQVVGAYTISSANDFSQRDPYSWTLSGSNDGSNFTVIDARSSVDFTTRFQTRLFEISNTTAYRYYRFDFLNEFATTGNNPAGGLLQFAELELLPPITPDGMVLPGGLIGGDLTDPEDDGSLAGIYSVGNSNSPSGEEPLHALDNTTATKWLSFAPEGTWWQFQFSAGPTLVNAYTITSANDADNRDPYSWTLSGSNDGVNFTVVDTRAAQDFATRFETRRYAFSSSAAYEYYRFDFETEFGATGHNQPVALQLAEIELFDDGAVDYSGLIDIDVESDWNAHQTSVYQRIPFNAADPAALSSLLLKMQYDDGFVAYLNGVRVAEANAPSSAEFNSNATALRENVDAVTVQSFDLSANLDLLVPGVNVLAIQGLNVSDNSADLLIRGELTATEVIDAAYVPGFYIDPTPQAVNNQGLLGFVEEATFSTEHGFYDAAFQLQLSTATPGAEIYYTVNGSAPTPASGTLYTSPITVDETTALRAAAFKDDYIQSASSTQTYLFINDIVSQNYSSTLAAGFPTSWGGATPDYGMDPQVIGNFDANGNYLGGDLFGGAYAATIKDDLQAIPSMSIVLDIDDMFGPNGIYSNPTAGGVAWERATSFELINPDGSPGFQVNAGIRIQGGAFRMDSLSKKHSLRLLFKGEYGPTKLEYPLFGADAADKFDTITLRMDSNDGYAWDAAGAQAQYARDEFGRRTQLALGEPGSHGTRAHLYINGVYWGLYNPVERPDASFAATYYGGDKDNWDVLNDGSLTDGNAEAWNTLQSLSQAVASAPNESARTAAYMHLQGKNPDGSNDPTAEDYLDIDNYIDYMIANFYGGNVDWPHRNWYAARERGPDSTGFKFHMWDMETALGLGSDINTNRTGVSVEVAAPYNALRTSAEFHLKFADRAQRALFNDGALTEANAAVRYQKILAEIDQAIVAESARWGDMHNGTPYTKAQWQNEGVNVVNNFLDGRTNILLNQLRSAGLFPSINAPLFNQRGGQVVSGFDATLSNPNGSGTIYYTTDGSDPRMPGGGLSSSGAAYSGPIDITAATTLTARTYSGGQWSAIDQVAFTVSAPADATNLRITEINFNPHDANPLLGELDVDNDEFEFIELQNISAAPINLDSIRFAQVDLGGGNEGVDFTFPQQTLAPGDYVLLVENQEAFESRYGAGLNIAGKYGGKLSNGGETLTLLAADNSTIQQFAYDDDWQPTADGAGGTLVAIDPQGDYNSAANWRASAVTGGTPGGAEPLSPGDFNNDGSVDGEDLNRWQTGYGTLTNATVGDGDADSDGDVDGFDFLTWQRNANVTTSPLAAAASFTTEETGDDNFLQFFTYKHFWLDSPQVCSSVTPQVTQPTRRQAIDAVMSRWNNAAGPVRDLHFATYAKLAPKSQSDVLLASRSLSKLSKQQEIAVENLVDAGSGLAIGFSAFNQL